jgi:long-chain acyl-CoA synthetase
VIQVRRPRGAGLLAEGAARAAALATLAVTILPDRLAHLVVFRRVRAATGGRLRGAISGGGLMPPHVDRFFRVIEVPILVGYGLTETSPVVTVRLEERNVLGTIGRAIPEVEVTVRDPDTGSVQEPGTVGLIFTRGPHVMRGYYQDLGLTREVVDPQGWFNTGDLGYMTEAGDVVFHGRAKETIVLAGGENVEPTHVESALLASRLISQAFVVGQDKKTLAALLLPEPGQVAQAIGLAAAPTHAELAADARVRSLLQREAVRLTAPLAPFERIARVALLPEPLDVADGTLTQTLKLRRHVITQRYHDLIEGAYTG